MALSTSVVSEAGSRLPVTTVTAKSRFFRATGGPGQATKFCAPVSSDFVTAERHASAARSQRPADLARGQAMLYPCFAPVPGGVQLFHGCFSGTAISGKS